jgi:hypothetical protein
MTERQICIKGRTYFPLSLNAFPRLSASAGEESEDARLFPRARHVLREKVSFVEMSFRQSLPTKLKTYETPMTEYPLEMANLPRPGADMDVT